jgi:potassium voltage-gated channel subfamily F member 1
MNLVDIFTVLPFFCELALSHSGIGSGAERTFKDFAGAMLVMRVLRVLRMARVFKLARYSTGLQAPNPPQIGHSIYSISGFWHNFAQFPS